LNSIVGLFDVIVITIGRKKYFGVIVSVKKIHVCDANNKVNQHSIGAMVKQSVKIELHIAACIYVSKKCAEAVEQQQKKNNSKKLKILKISNITSSIRMIRAIHQLEKWPYRRSLIVPKVEDQYFRLPSAFLTADRKESRGFNSKQSGAIDMSEYMYDNNEGRLRLMIGPPGEIPFNNSCCVDYRFCSSLFI
jgi:hypothetical protein